MLPHTTHLVQGLHQSLSALQVGPTHRLLLALSGGADSVALLHLLLQLGYTDERLVLAHCNFQLRGVEAEEDESFVRALARRHGLRLHVRRFDTQGYAVKHKLSIQEAARNLRYDYFEHLLAQDELDYIVTAHHQDDHIETALLQLLRGKDFQVMAGIAPLHQRRLRPLLGIGKEALLVYLKENQLLWREDSSNASDDYLRNHIRHQLLPVLAQINPNVQAQLAERVALLQQQNELLQQTLHALLQPYLQHNEHDWTLQAQTLVQQQGEQQAYLALYQWLREELHCSYDEVQAIWGLVHTQSGRHIETAHWLVTQDHGKLVLQATTGVHTTPMETLTLATVPGSVQFGQWLVSVEEKPRSALEAYPPSNTLYCDASWIEMPIRIRRWQAGDRYRPLGMKGTRKVSDILTDAKVPSHQRKGYFVLCVDDDIIYLQGQRIADEVKLMPHTQRVLVITWQQV